MKIKVLSQSTVNKISAGEVLERPSSAVKELVENSLDAMANKIDIFTINGGKTLIKVVDNGEGISEKDLPLSIKRHATSKLKSENLLKIDTLGFRGEALSSISAVSNLKIISKFDNDKFGYEMFLIEGEIQYIKPNSMSKGTSIEVKDLFFSTPARLKFLKSEKYETFLTKKILHKLALSNPNVEFNFYNNDKLIFSTHPLMSSYYLEKLKKRVNDIFGKEFLDNLIDFEQDRENFKFFGLIGLPTFNFSNNSNQFIFVNNRTVNDKLIFGSIKTAYRDYMFHDRFPQVIIFIKCPYNEVDINVHPTKSEVRFLNSNQLRSNLINSIRTTLSTAGHRSSSVNSSRAIKSVSTNNEMMNFRKMNSVSFQENTHLKKNNEEFIKTKSNKQSKANDNLNEDASENNLQNFLGSARNQFHKTYIISETQDGIVIIDQHAAHERIVYEKLKKEFYQKKVITQMLLIPEIIDCDSNIVENIISYKSQLKKYGLVIEKFGNDSVLVREIPFILLGCKIKQLIFDVVEELSSLDNSELLETQINKICSSMACHGSIRAGREMKIEEMESLLREMEDTPFSGQCNHGRPTYVELKLNDIEKLFGRK